jgi:uncharacterized protein YcaQ
MVAHKSFSHAYALAMPREVESKINKPTTKKPTIKKPKSPLRGRSNNSIKPARVRAISAARPDGSDMLDMLNTSRVSALQARRLLLGAQGLLDDPTGRCTPRRVRELIERMGFVQIDSINTIERAHHLTLASRIDNYRPAMLANLLEDSRELFEHWTHDASAIPSQWFPHWRHRFERARHRIHSNAWWRQRIGPNHEQIIEQVRQHITEKGPVLSREFTPENGHAEELQSAEKEKGWWSWKPQKAALEYLWRTGELAVARRINFQKVYDLTHRVLPDIAAQPAPSHDDHVDWACSTAMERLVIATPAELAGFWNAISLAQARAWCEQARNDGRITLVQVESLDDSPPRASFAVVDWKLRVDSLPAPPVCMRMLSPFDPVLRDRRRCLRLFGFDYRFEAFVPAPKRIYGYYTLPLLERDRLVGRVDAAFERSRETLRVRRVWWEPDARRSAALQKRFNAAAERLAEQIGAADLILPG